MDLLTNSWKQGNLHHAYAFEGEKELILENLNDFLKNSLEIEISGNPDYSLLSYDTFGIDEAREIAQRQANRSFTGGKKIFIITSNSITVEAQNSLLKVFEEPASETHFFLILNSYERLLPTLRSRLIFAGRFSGDSKKLKTIGRKFIDAKISERLEQIQEIAGKDSELSSQESKNMARDLLNGVEIELCHQIQEPDSVSILSEVMKAKSYLEDRSPSVKLLLEQLAVTIPV